MRLATSEYETLVFAEATVSQGVSLDRLGARCERKPFAADWLLQQGWSTCVLRVEEASDKHKLPKTYSKLEVGSRELERMWRFWMCHCQSECRDRRGGSVDKHGAPFW